MNENEAEVATFLWLNDEIVRVTDLGFPERRFVRDDPNDPFTRTGRVYARLMGSGVGLMAPDALPAKTWRRDSSLSLADCNAGLESFLADLLELDEADLQAISRGISRALAEQLFVLEWDLQ